MLSENGYDRDKKGLLGAIRVFLALNVLMIGTAFLARWFLIPSSQDGFGLDRDQRREDKGRLRRKLWRNHDTNHRSRPGRSA
jgi:hypothetical protein